MTAETGRPGSLYRQYAGDPAENYERHFTPAIGVHFARPVVEGADLGNVPRLDLVARPIE